MKAVRALLVVTAGLVLWLGALVLVHGSLSVSSSPSPVRSTYQGSSVTCAELQSEFNAAAARVDAYHAHGRTAKSDLQIMNTTNARMITGGC